MPRNSSNIKSPYKKSLINKSSINKSPNNIQPNNIQPNSIMNTVKDAVIYSTVFSGT